MEDQLKSFGSENIFLPENGCAIPPVHFMSRINSLKKEFQFSKKLFSIKSFSPDDD